MDGDGPSPSKQMKTLSLIEKFEKNRTQEAKNVMKFKFNKKRVRLLNNLEEVQRGCKGILYWMFRDVRVHDNWALLFAQKTALKNKLPLHICFCIMPNYLDATIRYYKFLIGGLKEVEEECKQLNIQFHLLHGEPDNTVLQFVERHKIGAVITDFCPLKLPTFWVDNLQKSLLPKNIPLCQVDAHNIVPCWYASDRKEYSARTIRNKIEKKLKEFLTEFPPVIRHTYQAKPVFERNNWETILQNVDVNKTVDEITWAKPGYKHGTNELENFIMYRLQKYDSEHKNPLADALSNLSPWFHFGMISVQRCILEIKGYEKVDSSYENSVKNFMEEAIIRRELSDNFCFYNENYESLTGAPDWAIETLNKHRDDNRDYVYTLEEFEQCLTHDDLWNACQYQMVKTGKMHGYLRMYWAKKILEWSTKPEEALQFANYLNNKYSIDGCDPNGYVGCMWSICGVHDQGFGERKVFGKIRFMNHSGCKRNFKIKDYVAKWGKDATTNNK